MDLTLAYSPCPNDTFMFYGISSGKLTIPDYTIQTHLHDIETLNAFALEGKYHITKLSFHCYFYVSQKYDLLPVGAALGYGCGPVLVSSKTITKDQIAQQKIAVPGKYTTAHLLLKLYAPEAQNKIFVPYDQIISSIKEGKADCGVIIHESRFLFEQFGLKKITDLGQWWEEETKLPIPLGAIAIKKELTAKLEKRFQQLLIQSIDQSTQNPEKAMPYITQHAKELKSEVLHKHINTFVNKFSRELGKEGREAIETLKTMIQTRGGIHC